MTALELMDPKMDSIPDEPPVDHPSLILENHQHLSLMDLLSLIKRLITCEVAYLDGSSLAETVFTCLFTLPEHMNDCINYHLNNSGQEKNRTQVLEEWASGKLQTDKAGMTCLVLMSYVVGVLKSCQVARLAVLLADIYEEEEFCATQFDFSFCEDIHLPLAQALLEQSEKQLLKATKTVNETEMLALDLLLSLYRARKHTIAAFTYHAKLYGWASVLPEGTLPPPPPPARP
eukprot:CAMPEP_0206367508 /NCGR_PEP_ID=MMETSP0294-20121207/4093_1 /ASSEMBLY_ACC=CAM_ASM_000327 /TAXON_ID=39354 /ORGANISM="Heterosigma akashiwo, Strain CCMP2393" /LENGTH=231 /DNA_ID=CAMNT_0053813785 /DNA_START=5 /DNA_END=696 /DNA_ORIENTATION=-